MKSFYTNPSLTCPFSVYLSILLLVNLLPATGWAQTIFSGLPFAENFSTKVYKGGIQNWGMAQDNRGLIYVANNLGLLEFDGNDWEIYRIPNGSKVRSVLASPNGRIYISAQNEFGYFFPNQLGSLVYHSLSDSLYEPYKNFGEAWGISMQMDGTIYFSSFRYLFEYKEGKLTPFEHQTNLEFTFMVNQKLYSSSPGQGLYLFQDNQLKLLPKGDFFADKRISSIIPFDQHRLLITTFEHGAFLYSYQEISRWKIQLGKQYLTQLNCALRLRDGRIAIGTQSDGLIVTNNNGAITLHMNRNKGLTSRTILSLYQDENENLWAGMNNGISFIELGSPFTLLNEEAGLPGTGYSACLVENNLFLGTNNGVYRYEFENGLVRFDQIKNSDGLQTYKINNLGGEVLIGSHQGAFALRNNQLKQITDHPGIWNFTPLPTDPSHLLVGTYNGFLYFSLENGRWVSNGPIPHFIESSRVVETTPTSVWMAHGYKGVFQLEFRPSTQSFPSINFYNGQNGFPTDEFISVFKVKNQLIFTSEAGFYQYDPEKEEIIPYPFYNELLGSDRHIRYLEESPDGHLYYIDKDYKVGKINFDGFEATSIESSLFNKVSGLLNDDLEFMAALDYQNVLIAAKEGFIHYNPSTKKPTEKAFSTLLRKVEILTDSVQLLYGGSHLENGEVVYTQPTEVRPKLPYEQNSLRFTYSSNFFESRELLEFQYLLEGFSKDWSEWEKSHSKDFTNLSSGNYTFKVRARNVYGVVSPETTFSFYVHPPWYLSAYAYVLYGFLFVSAYVITLTYTKRKHEIEKKVMTMQQERELIAKDNQIDQVNKQSKEAINQLKNEKLQAEIEHKNKELATATMLMVNKNTFISSVKHGLTSVMQKTEGKSATINRELQKIVKTIDKNLSQANDWEQFQHHFDKVHGDFSRRFSDQFPNLTPQERKLSAYLRMNMSSKEIASLMNISVRGVEISRYRLRKKLNLNQGENLTEFILNF